MRAIEAGALDDLLESTRWIRLGKDFREDFAAVAQLDGRLAGIVGQSLGWAEPSDRNEGTLRLYSEMDPFYTVLLMRAR